ncbi:MAG: HAD family hydrolase [Nannocystaceae bacterium]|nr:HAD-IA family hydrolase [bacterium]
MAAPRAVIFDLDGTLADSLADIAASTNACLAEAGLPTHDAATVRSFVGGGIGMLVERALGPHATPQNTERLLAAIRSHYAEHCTDETRLYDGVEATLARLDAQDVRLGVVSNKPDGMTQHMVATLMPSVPFGFVTGERPDIPRKPDPTGILTACSTLGVPPSAAIYVGDTAVDVEASRAAGLRSVAVAWGFRDRSVLAAAKPDHLIDHPRDLLPLV